MMKSRVTYILLIITLFSVNTLLCQNEENASNRFSLGLVFAPQFSNWSYNYKSEYQDINDLMDSIYKDKNGFSFGFIAEYHFNKSSIKSGLQTSLYPYETVILDVNNPANPEFSCGLYSNSGTDYYIDIPFIYKYSFFRTKTLNIFLGAGVINKFLFYSRTKVFSHCNGVKELINSSAEVVNDFQYYIAASIETGIEVSLIEKLVIGFFPSFEYSLNNKIKEGLIKRKYYQLGLNLSVGWKI